MVHALHAGLPLCMFSRDVPENWPDGHRWTYPGDIENITCPGCRQEAMRLKEAEKGLRELSCWFFSRISRQI